MEKKKMFDFVIGNPPYQDSESVNNRAGAVYPFFYDVAEKLAEASLLISPARFLFNTGLTSKEWNEKMLNDSHIKVLEYYPDSSSVFSNTDIKGGVVTVYRNNSKHFEKIETFIPDPILRTLATKFSTNENEFSAIMHGGRSDLKFNDIFLQDYPKVPSILLGNIRKKHPSAECLSPNEEYELKSSSFETLSSFFVNEKPKDEGNYYKLVGLLNGKRVLRYIERKYMTPRYPNNNNVNSFKVFVPESNGSGAIGEVLSTPLIGTPLMSCTPTFISIGSFNSLEEAEHCLRYIKTKFCRVLLGIMKTTQHNPAPAWKYVPLQDFTSSSDIDWSKSIHEIDLQLYKKYGLDQHEIDFIETHVKEMV